MKKRILTGLILMKHLNLLFMTIFLLVALLMSACQPIVMSEGSEVGMSVVSPGGMVHEVYPTHDPTQDIANIQAAIDGAAEGDTILLKAGVFNFGDWKTNPIPGGYVVINKGVTLMGDGFDAEGNPKTIIQGGNYRQKNHWEQGEVAVITFGGDGSGGVLDSVWLKEPHFRGIGVNGFSGQSHENVTIRSVKITDISQDIAQWSQDTTVARSITIGANVPEWEIGGPSGTITIENCYISNMGSSLDLNFIDPDTGDLYYTGPEGQPMATQHNQASHAIGLWINTSANFVVRNNTIRGQHEGIVMEYMSGSGDILMANNDIAIETVSLPPNIQRGIRMTTCDGEEFPFASTRTVRIENNRVAVVGAPGEDFISEGILLSNDNGVEGFAARYVVTGNEVDIQDGYAAIVMGSSIPEAILRGAEISHNRITGTADYGLVSTKGAQYNKILANDMTGFESAMANVGLYGSETHQNLVRGNAGPIDVGLGAYRNDVMMGPRTVKGEIQFPSPPEWPVDLWVTFDIDIQELDPKTHAAEGTVDWGIFYYEHDEWKKVTSEVEYVLFAEDGEAAVFVTQINEKTGPGQGQTGDHACFWVRDDKLGDQFGIHYYHDTHPDVGFKEFWPQEELPELAYQEPLLPIDIALGGVAISR